MEENQISWSRLRQSKTLLLISTFVAILILIPSYPPTQFSNAVIVTISPGTTISDAGEILVQAGVVKNATFFRIINSFGVIHAGTYLFERPQNMFVVAHRVRNGVYGFMPIRITFPEGNTARDMARRITEKFPHISAEEFLNEARPYEGYLFPDTYLFMPPVSPTEIVDTMRENFDKKTSFLTPEALAGRTLSDVIIMASLIEKEARTKEVRHLISGILWNRLEIGMPLQVDAVFGYIFNTDTYSPSFSDLKVDSPYNTYTHRGLPPGPISNPGIESINAARGPTKTHYLYYLTGNDGKMHYASTYAGHQENQRHFLK